MFILEVKGENLELVTIDVLARQHAALRLALGIDVALYWLRNSVDPAELDLRALEFYWTLTEKEGE